MRNTHTDNVASIQMDDTTTDDGTDASPPPEEADAEPKKFYAEGLEVHNSGAFTLPSRHRDYFGIEHRDIVDVFVFTADTAFSATDLIVDESGRVRIPNRKRKLYGIEDGDRVDIEVQPTGMTLPAE